MAKVYDALKRVEEERRLLTLAPGARDANPGLELVRSPRPGARKWWRGNWGRRVKESELTSPSASSALLELESVLTRLDSIEKRTAEQLPAVEAHLRHVTEILPTVEDRLRQTIEARLRSIEDEYRVRLVAVTEEVDRRMHQINGRLAILLGTVVLMIVLALFRS